MSNEAIIGILIAAISVLAGVIGFLWKLFLQPLVTQMIALVKTMQEEQPKQTEALRDIRQSNKAIKHASAVQAKLQKVAAEKLDTLVDQGEAQKVWSAEVARTLVAKEQAEKILADKARVELQT